MGCDARRGYHVGQVAHHHWRLSIDHTTGNLPRVAINTCQRALGSIKTNTSVSLDCASSSNCDTHTQDGCVWFKKRATPRTGHAMAPAVLQGTVNLY